MARNETGAGESAPTITRVCRRCGTETPLTHMKIGGRAGQRSTICRRCDAELCRNRYWADPEGARAKQRERNRRPEDRARRRARRLRNLEAERAQRREYARTERGRELNRLAVQRWQSRNQEKVAAAQEARRAAKRGEIVIPQVCEVIGCANTGTLHLHHPDYARPREVIRLCHLHHEATHHDGPQRLRRGKGRPKYATAPAANDTGPPLLKH